jgi:hypothetical protein
VLIGFVPDDAFYELQIGRHFLATGKWLFDGSLTTTTGFHLLNGRIVYDGADQKRSDDRPLRVGAQIAIRSAISSKKTCGTLTFRLPRGTLAIRTRPCRSRIRMSS